jgi:hypothetical protein
MSIGGSTRDTCWATDTDEAQQGSGSAGAAWPASRHVRAERSAKNSRSRWSGIHVPNFFCAKDALLAIVIALLILRALAVARSRADALLGTPAGREHRRERPRPSPSGQDGSRPA